MTTIVLPMVSWFVGGKPSKLWLVIDSHKYDKFLGQKLANCPSVCQKIGRKFLL
jgi:hypothetical protein